MWWHAGAADLHRVEDRISTVYVERCHLDRDENAVVFINRQQRVRLPAAMIGALLLGPGTRVTQAAMVLLGDSGTSVCWVGEHGVRMYSAGLGPARSAHVIQRQAFLVSRREDRLRVAKNMYVMRFPDDDVADADLRRLRGMEGARVKKLYREHSERTGVKWVRREYKAGDAYAAGDDVNRVLSAANKALYGLVHAAIVGVGASPALGFVHTGSAVSFVLDIADLYKAEYTIPLAFELAAAGRTEESDARWALRDRIKDGRLMPRVVKDILSLLLEDKVENESASTGLWSEDDTVLPQGHNWDLDWFLANPDYAVIEGPNFDEVPF
ncbi:subtype I-E CRISPR-associated endonuclease Cas1 [Parenemella sanctibonifatiensis]|uniref:CRISPR-associated endonuclease Cas1 n=2 Tax=Parenemella sanctibonifatiensis TaxID=2016505 RepID=A0A255EDT8_9ACTN|nr:subtype I-E CRISPR-associated endonuclease Cas1 [Parenemella sanctibonifatiensis]